MKVLFSLFLSIVGFCSLGQTVTISPEITPALFRHNDQITVTYDVTGTALASLSAAYIWVWIPTKNIDAKYNINPATAAADAAQFTKTVGGGKTTFSITFKPSDFFAASISAETKLGVLIKGTDWSNGQSTDYVADIWDGGFQLKLTTPAEELVFINNGEGLLIEAETPAPSDYTLSVNNVVVDTKSNLTTYSYTHAVTETTGVVDVKLSATNGTASDEVAFKYIVSNNSPVATRPVGITPGINYHSGDHTKVTLCLLAPDKSSAYVRGDFSDWEVLPSNLMNRDGEYFWIEISGLTSGVEYGFQYLVDETVYLVDPFVDKILDGDNDQYIPSATYADLKAYPEKARSDKWYFNKVGVFQTNQTPYQWQVTDFEKPAKENLVVYELLVRDFFADDQRNYQNLIDTLAYIKRLGVTAIELMPIMEFAGNDSWGYNPVFMFAPDKYYGTKNKFKEFIDVCHQNGIAVILDIALNHQDMPNPYLLMDFNFNTQQANPTNKWFNVKATHPFSVFYDMNHGSSYTQAYMDTINHYWLNEYKIDGFRFDLSKGFSTADYCTTANCDTGTEISAWSAYDATRIALLKRMADKIWQHTPDAYVILEHLSVNSEEKELAEYRTGEGKGMLLWGNLNYAYSQNAMGYATGSDISWISHTTRGWSVPHVVGYMESHDEERMMYRNLQYGATGPSYNVKELETALDRVKAAATIFYTMPGPKMLWQFGELGYDISIDEGGRTSAKPVKWEYQSEGSRKRLYRHISNLIDLKNKYDVFQKATPTFAGSNTLTKQVMLKNNPYVESPTSVDDMNAVIVVNFEVTAKNIDVAFPHTGIWYDLFEGGSPVEVTSTSQTMSFERGQYRILTDVYLSESIITGIEDNNDLAVNIFPNPTTGRFSIGREYSEDLQIMILNTQGVQQAFRKLDDQFDISGLAPGMYIVKIVDRQNRQSIRKLIKL